MNKFYALSALAFVGSEAKINACGLNDYQIGWKAFNQGFQADRTSMTTDCFLQSVTTISSVHTFRNSFYYYQSSDWLAPLYLFSELGIEMTNSMSAC